MIEGYAPIFELGEKGNKDKINQLHYYGLRNMDETLIQEPASQGSIQSVAIISYGDDMQTEEYRKIICRLQKTNTSSLSFI